MLPETPFYQDLVTDRVGSVWLPLNGWWPGAPPARIYPAQDYLVGRRVIHANGLWYNPVYSITLDGGIQVYHKINLANHECGIFTAGDGLPTFTIDTGEGSVVVAVWICSKLRFSATW